MIFKILCISILIVLLMLIDNHHKFKPYGTWKSPNNTNMHFVFNLRNVLLFNLFSNYYCEYYLSDYCSVSFVFIFVNSYLFYIVNSQYYIQIVYFSATCASPNPQEVRKSVLFPKISLNMFYQNPGKYFFSLKNKNKTWKLTLHCKTTGKSGNK